MDDDKFFASGLSDNLVEEGYDAVPFWNALAARNWLMNERDCDLILLDWYMPEVPGSQFIRSIRDNGIDTPVIVLTGVAKDYVEDLALGIGAEDFIDKGRRFSIILKRIRHVLEAPRPGGQFPRETDCIDLGPLTILEDQRRARWRGEEVPLTMTEYKIVRLLASKPGTDWSYRCIYDVVHGEGFIAGDGEDGVRVNVRSLIRRIRRKFTEIDPGFEMIENYAGFGYRWSLSDGPEAPRRRNDRARLIGADSSPYQARAE